MRSKAKVLFLSYTYGMSLDNIIKSVKEMGGSQRNARKYFSDFVVFEDWKSSVHQDYLREGRVGTIFGNYLYRVSEGELTEKEKRKSVNHVIQGTATYIFKSALLELSMSDGVEVLMPMHDAILFQHNDQFEPLKAKEIFEKVMSEILSSIKGKASLESFFCCK